MTMVLAAPAPAPRPFAVLAALMAALLALALLWGLGETRPVDGALAWVKPAKFALALFVTFATLALVQSRLSPPRADGWLMSGTAAVMGAAALFEMGYMGVQAASGEASHFNIGDPYHAIMYALMGVFATLLTVGIGVVGVVALRDRAARLSPALRRAIGWSFLATVPLVLVTAGWLSGNGGHFVGVHPAGGATMPLLSWSLETGDLRPAHFAALHLMQGVPLWVLARERLGGQVGSAEVASVTGLGAALALALFAQALAGRPIL